MRYTEIMEARSAPLFHMMDGKKAINVFETDAIEGRWTHNIPGMGERTGTSLTRNNNNRMLLNRVVRLTLDQEKLSARYKIVPLDGEVVFAQTQNLRVHQDRKLNLPNAQLREEFLIGDIAPLHRYLMRIDIREGDFSRLKADDALRIAELIPAYAEQHNIELVIHPGFIDSIEYIREVRRNWDED